MACRRLRIVHQIAGARPRDGRARQAGGPGRQASQASRRARQAGGPGRGARQAAGSREGVCPQAYLRVTIQSPESITRSALREFIQTAKFGSKALLKKNTQRIQMIQRMEITMHASQITLFFKGTSMARPMMIPAANSRIATRILMGLSALPKNLFRDLPSSLRREVY